MDDLHIVTTRNILRALSHATRLSPIQTAIVAVLWAMPGKIYSLNEIADVIYGGDADGGPEGADRCIQVQICRMRKADMPIRSHGWRGYSYDQGYHWKHH